MSNQCDLQAISIDPLKTKLKVAKSTTVKGFFKNNGPDEIPSEEAIVQITVGGKFLHKPGSLKSTKGSWEVMPVQLVEGNWQLFFRNKTPMVKDATIELSFTVKGKREGKADITVTSTVMGTSSDIQGENQSVRCELIVTK